jgi:hypothetical protein
MPAMAGTKRKLARSRANGIDGTSGTSRAATGVQAGAPVTWKQPVTTATLWPSSPPSRSPRPSTSSASLTKMTPPLCTDEITGVSSAATSRRTASDAVR